MNPNSQKIKDHHSPSHVILHVIMHKILIQMVDYINSLIIDKIFNKKYKHTNYLVTASLFNQYIMIISITIWK